MYRFIDNLIADAEYKSNGPVIFLSMVRGILWEQAAAECKAYFLVVVWG